MVNETRSVSRNKLKPAQQQPGLALISPAAAKQRKRDVAAQAETTYFYDSLKQPASAGWGQFVPYSNSIFFPQLFQIRLTYLVTQNPLSFTFLAVA